MRTAHLKCLLLPVLSTVCPRNLDRLYIISYYIKWVKTSWTYIKYVFRLGIRLQKKNKQHELDDDDMVCPYGIEHIFSPGTPPSKETLPPVLLNRSILQKLLSIRFKSNTTILPGHTVA